MEVDRSVRCFLYILVRQSERRFTSRYKQIPNSPMGSIVELYRLFGRSYFSYCGLGSLGTTFVGSLPISMTSDHNLTAGSCSILSIYKKL
uniref:Uncharacterized protein n=1 Tax=Kalanchoe fedtschenkoi TaxID=63787 RepID=A0A7N0VI87_KALFE